MQDTTPQDRDMSVYDLLEVIENAIEASRQFTREDGIGDWRCMTLTVGAPGGRELLVTVTIPGAVQ